MLRHRRYPLALIAALSAALLLLAVNACGPRGRGDASDLRLLWTGAMLGFVEPCGCTAGRIGGMDRMAAFVRSELDRHPAALYVDTGDAFLRYHGQAGDHGGSPFPAQQAPIKAEAFMRTFASLGIAALAVGDLELEIGHTTLVDLAQRHGVPLINANIVDAAGQPIFQPYVVVERGGKRIGIFSLLAERLRSDEIDDKRPVDVARVVGGQNLRLLNWRTTAVDVVRTLRETERVDMVLLASHLGARHNQTVARDVPGIDIVFGPHSDDSRRALTWVEGVPVLNGSVRGARVGVVDWWMTDRRAPLASLRPPPMADVSDDVWLEFELGVHRSDLAMIAGRESILGSDEFQRRRQTSEQGVAAVERMLVERPARPAGDAFSAMLIPLHVGIGRDEGALDSIDHYHGDLFAHWSADPPAPRHPTDRFTGPASCESCHPAQTEFWRGTRHSRAFQTLIATQQHVDLECIGCHTVGLHLPGGFRHPAASAGFENVQCAACHGPEGGHMAGGASYIDPTVFRPPLQSCAHCHNKEHDPTFMQRAPSMIPLVSCPPLDPPGRGPLGLRAALVEGAQALAELPDPPWLRISDAYQRAGDVNNAVVAAQRGVDATPDSRDAKLRLAQRTLEQGRFQDALDLASDLTGADTSDGLAWQVRALALVQMGQREDALAAALEAHSLLPADLDSAALAARAYRDLGRRLDAIDTLRRFAADHPASGAAVQSLIEALQ